MNDDGNYNESNRPEVNLSKDMAQFYQVLGTYNANMIARVRNDPNSVRDVIKVIIAQCPVHDAQCGDNYVYDHQNNVCIRLLAVQGD